MFYLKDQLNSYFIMPRYGLNLEYYCEKQKFKLSKETILNIGIAMIRNL